VRFLPSWRLDGGHARARLRARWCFGENHRMRRFRSVLAWLLACSLAFQSLAALAAPHCAHAHAEATTATPAAHEHHAMHDAAVRPGAHDAHAQLALGGCDCESGCESRCASASPCAALVSMASFPDIAPASAIASLPATAHASLAPARLLRPPIPA
jgi:hypothetical protein